MKKRKPLDDMTFQELVEHLNKIREHKHYASLKGFTLMVEQLDLEIEAAETAYHNLLAKEKEEYDKRHNVNQEESSVIFETSDSLDDDDD